MPDHLDAGGGTHPAEHREKDKHPGKAKQVIRRQPVHEMMDITEKESLKDSFRFPHFWPLVMMAL
jgi:hypothetical protein